MLGWTHIWQIFLAFGVALAAGGVNSLAGGGSILTFPTLIWLGLPPVMANATNTVAVWPGTVSAAWHLRGEMVKTRSRWLWLGIPSLLGGGLGAWLLLNTKAHIFRGLAPWLILAATCIFACEGRLRARTATGRLDSVRWAMFLQFLIALYGGYFGAGIGILMLTTLGLLEPQNIQLQLGLKNLFATLIKGVAVVYFILAHEVVWHAGLLMAVATVGGGWAGAQFARRVQKRTIRRVVVTIGVVLSVALLIYQK
jgi:uncharacterized membrane protein YfcA